MSDFDRAIQEARRLAETPEGKQLASLLSRLGGGDLQQSISKAAAGDFSQAQQAISALMQDSEARKLLEKLGGGYGK